MVQQPARKRWRRRGDRRGFTLVELLVVITILAIIASMIIFALIAAQTRAREEKTRSMIAKIDGFFMTRWEQYESRRVPLNLSAMRGAERDRKRLDALYELQRLEFPDSTEDIKGAVGAGFTSKPAATLAYDRILKTSKDSQGNPSQGHKNEGDYRGAECLFMILTTGMCGEESARMHFKDSEIGDADNDGLLEFLDAWDMPIMFLRWAPGHISPMQPQEYRQNPKKYHCPFDPKQVNAKAWRMTPLIFSAGADLQYDIRRKDGSGAAKNDPYSGEAGKPEDQDSLITGGKDGVENDKDNISNHLLGLR